jgi:hypothetical protein
MDLIDEIERRAFQFFWEQADPNTGLINDRAGNFGPDDYSSRHSEATADTVASIAATGYGLAALPVGIERGWVDHDQAVSRARVTLEFSLTLAHQHGWIVHFVDKRTGERVWQSEFSTIDTVLLVAGALAAGQYFAARVPEIAALSDQLYRRLDWWWVLTNDGTQPDKRMVSQGTRLESGFITNNWWDYSEAVLLYLLGLGAPEKPLPDTSWESFERPLEKYGGLEWLRAGPIFIHQMPYGYFNLRNQRDRLGFDYWLSSINAMKINRRFCRYRAKKRKTYAEGFWGLNASDGPDGYKPYGVAGDPEDGTVSPTGAIASIIFTPDLAMSVAQAMYEKDGGALWGKYGFTNAFNVDRNWHSPDVIGIDLGMALLAIENYRSGLIWKLMSGFDGTARALAAAGFRENGEAGVRLVSSKQ